MSIPSPIVLYNLSDATMKGLLPAGYTPLAYIESSGTLWINSEYVITSNKIHYSCKFKLGDLVSSSHIFGGNNSYSVYKGNPYISGNTLYFYINSSSYYNETVYKDEMLDIDMDMNAGSLNLYLNGKLHTASYSGTMSGGNSIALFHVNANNGTWNVIKGKMYYFKMWDNGSLVVDLHPCIQDSNGVIGMYDLVSRTFKTNSGSGSFIAGPELAVGKGGGKSLPEEYLLVEYIRIPGGGGINTGVTVTSGTKFVAEHVMTFQQLSSNSRDTSGYNGNGSGYWEVGNGNKYGTYTTYSITAGTRDKIVFTKTAADKGNLVVNGTTSHSCGDGRTGTYTIGGANGSYSGSRWKDVEYIKIWSADVLVRNMYACYRKSDMKPGMYDTVNGVFYTNAGSGEFILGPTVCPYYSWEPNAGTGTQQGLYTNLSGIYDSSKGWVAGFNGSNSRIYSSADLVSMFNTRTWSISFWFNTANLPSSEDPSVWKRLILYRKATTSDANTKQMVVYLTKTSIGTSFYSDDTAKTISGLAINTWYHVVITQNGGTATYYVNGNSLGTASKNSLAIPTGSYLQIGYDADRGMGAFNGKLSNVQVWDSVLTAAQVKELYGK